MRARGALALVAALAFALCACRQPGDTVGGEEALRLVKETADYSRLWRARAAEGHATRLRPVDLVDGWWRIDACDDRDDAVLVAESYRVRRADGRIERMEHAGWVAVEH